MPLDTEKIHSSVINWVVGEKEVDRVRLFPWVWWRCLGSVFSNRFLWTSLTPMCCISCLPRSDLPFPQTEREREKKTQHEKIASRAGDINWWLKLGTEGHDDWNKNSLTKPLWVPLVIRLGWGIFCISAQSSCLLMYLLWWLLYGYLHTSVCVGCVHFFLFCNVLVCLSP